MKFKNHRQELMVLSGTNHTSHIDVIQSGVSINSHMTLGEVPSLNYSDGLLAAGNKLFLRLYGQNNLIGMSINLKVAGPNTQKKALTLSEIET